MCHKIAHEHITSHENGIIRPRPPRNETVLGYAPGSPERASLEATLKRMAGETIDMPLVIGGREVRTGKLDTARMPHDHGHVLGKAHLAGAREIADAIEAAQKAWPDWSRRPWTERAAMFLKAADMLAGEWRPRPQCRDHARPVEDRAPGGDRLGRRADRFLPLQRRVHAAHVCASSRVSGFGVWNRVDYRPLEGFVYAVTPFNFTAIAGNLPSAPALMGNTVVWKPSATAKYSAHYIMKLLQAAGLPPGVINLVYGDPKQITDACRRQSCARRRALHRLDGRVQRHSAHGERANLPLLSAHRRRDGRQELRAGSSERGCRGAGDGACCAAASSTRARNAPRPRASSFRNRCGRALRSAWAMRSPTIRVGDVRDLRNFMGAVIDEHAWRKHEGAIAEARSHRRMSRCSPAGAPT